MLFAVNKYFCRKDSGVHECDKDRHMVIQFSVCREKYENVGLSGRVLVREEEEKQEGKERSIGKG